MLSVGQIPVLESIIPPRIFISPVDGKKYIVPYWLEIDDTITQEDIEKKRIRRIPKNKEDNPIAPETHSVKSSDGKTYYTVAFLNNTWSCDCPRYGFKRSCKHIDKIKAERLAV